MMYAVVDSNGVFIAQIRNPELYEDLTIFQANGQQLIEQTEEELDALLPLVETQKMQFGEGVWQISGILEDVKASKIKEARAYFNTRKTFILNGVTCWMTKEQCRNLYIDAALDEEYNLGNAPNFCSSQINMGDYLSMGTANYDGFSFVKTLTSSVLCYTRTIEETLNTKINQINLAISVGEVQAIDVEINYPSFLVMEV